MGIKIRGLGTKIRGLERVAFAALLGISTFALAPPARAEFCWEYVQRDSPTPISCVQIGNLGQFCEAENPFSQQPEGAACHHDGNLSDCCTTVPSLPGSQSIEIQHELWHECFGSIGSTNFPPTAGPPFGGRISPPGRGMRWYSFHRQLLTDFDLFRGTTERRIEWVRWGNDTGGNPQRLFHEYPSNPDTSALTICATRPNAVWRRGTELDPAGGPPCEENSSPDPLANGCKRYPDCLNVRTGVPSTNECGTGGFEYHVGNGGRLVVCRAASECRYFDDGTNEPNLVLPFVTSLEQFTDVEQITDLMDAYFHGAMHSAVATSGQDRCSLPPYQSCTTDGPCSYGTCVGGGGGVRGTCQQQFNGTPVPCYRDQDCGVCIADGLQVQGESGAIHRYCQDVASPSNSVRDPEFWRLHKSLDVVVEAWQQLKPVDIVVVLDVSGSMLATDAGNATRFQRAKEAAGMFATALSLAAQTNAPQSASRMGMIVYSSTNQTLLGGVLVNAQTLTPADIEAALQPITPNGCTGIGGALVAASQLLCGPQGCGRLADKRRGILLLTDGVENVPPCLFNAGLSGTCGSTCSGTAQQTEQIYNSLGNAQVCAVGFGDAAQINGDQLTLLAERQGGIYFHHAAVQGTGGAFTDLKQVFAKCFGLLSSDRTWLDPTGTMSFSNLGSDPVMVAACSETSANVMSGWDFPVEAGDMRLMLETPSGNLVRTNEEPAKSSIESTWAITRIPLPYAGEQQGEWRAQLIRPHATYVNGFTTDALPEAVGTSLVRRQIQRLCPEGCNDVLYFEDGHLGPVSSYEAALAAETASGLITSLVTAASPSDFELELSNNDWDLVVYAHQLTQNAEPYDETLAGILCGAFENTPPLAIVTDTRLGLPDALDINSCAGGVIEETPNVNYATIAGDGRLLAGTHILANQGYSIFSYGLLRATSAENGGDPQIKIDASLDRQNVATMALPIFTEESIHTQNWFAELTFQGDSLLQGHKPHFLARTTQAGLKPSAQILPSFVPEGGYDEVVATVTIDSPTIGTGSFVLQNGLTSTTVGGEQVSGRAGGLLAAAIPRTTSGPFVLNDDGVDGDEHPNNFYWTKEIPSLGHVDGMYNFTYDFRLTKNGCTSQRQLKQSVFVEVGVDPASSPTTSTTPPGGGVVIVDITPRDPYGNPWGPGRIPPITCIPAQSCTCGPSDVVDNLDGSYRVTIHRPPGPPGNCAIDGWGPTPIPVDNRLVANAGPDQVLQCTGGGRATGTLNGTGSSNPNGPLNFSWTAPPGVPIQNANQSIATGSFPLGSTTVTLTVSAGPHTASDTALISVLDTTPPILTAPPDVTAPTCTGVTIGQATAVDGCGGAVTIVNDAPTSFRAGTRIVTWRAIDRFGNIAIATQRVIVGLGNDRNCCPSGTTVRVGTSNNDTITGTSGSDCILGLGGQDVIRGMGGNDFLSGGDGNDTVEGGDGNDQCEGGTAQDILRGGNGTDVLLGFDGDDQCFGGPNDDRLYGGQGQDQLFGEDGNDSCFGEIGDDRLEGGAGNDLLNGGGLHDTCVGGTGTNTFVLCQTQQ